MHTPQQSILFRTVRWLGVLPVTVLAGVVGYFLGRAIGLAGLSARVLPESFSPYVADFFASAASSWLGVVCGCKLAPSHRLTAYAVLVLLVAGFNIPAISALFEEFSGMILAGLLGTALGLIGAVAATGSPAGQSSALLLNEEAKLGIRRNDGFAPVTAGAPIPQSVIVVTLLDEGKIEATIPTSNEQTGLNYFKRLYPDARVEVLLPQFLMSQPAPSLPEKSGHNRGAAKSARLAHDTPARPLTMERIESFLGDQTILEHTELANLGEEAVAQHILQGYAVRKRELHLHPDTPEAADAAEADFRRADEAEKRVAELAEEAPETWETIKRVVPRISSHVTKRDLERMEPLL